MIARAEKTPLARHFLSPQQTTNVNLSPLIQKVIWTRTTVTAEERRSIRSSVRKHLVRPRQRHLAQKRRPPRQTLLRQSIHRDVLAEQRGDPRDFVHAQAVILRPRGQKLSSQRFVRDEQLRAVRDGVRQILAPAALASQSHEVLQPPPAERAVFVEQHLRQSLS